MSLSSLVLLIIFSHADSVHSRIIGGVAHSTASNYAVEISAQFESYQTWGGGTLITPDAVVTRAKLVVGSYKVVVQFGSYQFSDMYSVEAKNYIYYPFYDAKRDEHDFALLRLSQSVDNGK